MVNIDYENNIYVLPAQRIEDFKSNEAKDMAIGFEIPKEGVKKGTYVFNVKAYKYPSPDQYDKTHKLQIIIN